MLVMKESTEHFIRRKEKEQYQDSRRRPIDEARHVARHEYAWPGGYQMAVVTTDGGLLCPDCVKAEWFNIADSARRNLADGWQPAATTLIYEGEETEYCSHCDRQMNNEEED